MWGDQMKRCISAIVAIVLCITLSSCASKQVTSSDDSYLKGIEQGYEDVFYNLWWAAANHTFLDHGEKWETDHFTITITSNNKEEGSSIIVKLTTNDITISECFDDKKMLINLFSSCEGQLDGLLTDDLFYWYAQMEEITDNTASATVGIYENTEKVLIVVAVDGCIYKASYIIPERK